MIEEIRAEIAKEMKAENLAIDSDVLEDLFLRLDCLLCEGATDKDIGQ